MARPAEELTDEGGGGVLGFGSGLRELLKTKQAPRPRRQIADTPHAIYANKQVRLAIFGKVKHTALHDKRRLQNDLFGTSTAPTGKTL